MMTRYGIPLVLACLLGGCASTQHREIAEQNRQSIDAALDEATAVSIPEAEAPPEDVLDQLVPGSGISLPGLAQDLRQEASFDVSVSNAPARLFFMSLVKDTSINMVVHPDVSGDISLDLKNVTVREVMMLAREVYGYEYQETQTGYVVLPARIQSRIFPVNYLNVARSGESLMTVSSGQIEETDTDSDSGDSSTSTSSTTSLKSSQINTRIEADFWTELQATLNAIVGGGDGRSIVVDRHAGLVIVRAMPGELRDVEAYLNSAQDNLQRQVILEAKVIEVTLSDSFQSGIDWAAISDSRDIAFGTSSVTGGVGGSALINDAGEVVVTSGLDVANNP